MGWEVSQLELARGGMDSFSNGNSITITRVTARGAFNTATGKRTPTTTTATLRAIVSRFRVDPTSPSDTPIWRARFSILAEECVDSGAQAFRPQATDKVTFRGRTWSLDKAPESRMGDQVYDLDCTTTGTMTTQ